MNKRSERVKSIFDSDDSDDDNNITNLGMSYHKDEEEDEDTKLRKTIEEVCSSLGNENEGSGELPKISMEEPNELFNSNEKKETHCSSDSEEDDKNIKKEDITPTSAKFVIPIIEEIEYNLLSKFCNETVDTSLEAEKSIESSQYDEVKENSLDEISTTDTKCSGVIASIINTDSVELNQECIQKADIAAIDVDNNIEMDYKKADVDAIVVDNNIEMEDKNADVDAIVVDDNIEMEDKNADVDAIVVDNNIEMEDKNADVDAIEMEDSNVKQLSEGNVGVQTRRISENFVRKLSSPCGGSEVTDCYDSIDNKVMDADCNRFPISTIKNNSEKILENNFNSGCDQTDISGVSDVKYHCDAETNDSNECMKKAMSEETSKQVNPVPTSKIGNFELELDKHPHNPSFNFDLSNSSCDINVKTENLIISPRPISPEKQVNDDLLINKMDKNVEIKSSPSSFDEKKEIMNDSLVNIDAESQSKSDETNFCLPQPLVINSSADSCITSTLEKKENEYFEPSRIPGKLATCEVNELKSNIKTTNDDNTPSLEEKDTVESSQEVEVKSDINCFSEGEKKRKVRVEDVFTDSESETASNFSPIKKPIINNIEHAHDSSIGPPLKKIRRKRPRATSINLPAIMLAFEKGWVREVVYRASANLPLFPKRADIYYYTPEGKKLRSRIEIEDYLKKNNVVDLSLQNFSFFKEPLGVEECYEKIRDASASKFPMTPTYINGDQLLNTASKKRIRKSAKFRDGLPPAKKLRTGMLNENNLEKDASGKIPLKETQRYYGAGNFSNVLNNYSPVYATHLFPCNPPLSYPRIITSLIKGASKDKAFHCTPNCFAGGGSVPNLQCVKCICLFHPDCCHVPTAAIPLILSLQAKFLCPNCYKEETENFEEKDFTPTPCFEPLAYDPPSDSEDEGLCSDFEHPSYTRLRSRPSSPQITSSNVRDLTNLHIPNIAMLSTPTGMPDSGICHGNLSHVQNSLLNDGLEPSMPQYIPPYLPNTSTISAAFPSSIKSVSAIALQLPSTYFHSTPSTPNSYPIPSPGIPIDDDVTGIPSQSPQKKDFTSKTSKQITPLLRGGEYFMEDMSKCYSVLRHIFSYLSVTDLLVVSRVCHMWRDLALGPTFWTSVRLRNVCVKDWGKMVEFLERRGTSTLDLRKMVLYIGMASQSAGNSTLENDFGRGLSDPNITEDLVNENRGGNQQIHKENGKDSDTENIDEFENISSNKHEESTQDQLDTDKHDESGDNIQNVPRQIKEKTVLPENESLASENKNVEMSEGGKETNKEFIKEESEIELKEDNLEIDALKQHNDCDSVMKVNNILSNEINSINENQLSPHSNKEENMSHFSEDSKDFKNMEANEKNDQEHEAEEEKLRVIQKDKIVTSVLSEHDYFGTQAKGKETEDSSNSSTDSDDSDSQLDQNEIEADRALDEKLEFHKKNVEDGNLKEMLQWEHEPQVQPEWNITAASCSSRAASQAEIREEEEEVELICKLKENMKQKALYKVWAAIANALSKLQCLRNIIVGPCESFVVELLLSHCFQLTGITALNLTNSDNEDIISFDPSFLMHTKQLKEFRLGSKKNFLFKSNFNFIKLPDLKVLMLKGLKTAETGWPYMGIHLTHLHLSCINTFSHKNWLNVSSMTGLLELELDGSGSDFDSEICLSLPKLVNLKRLALLDWNIGPKLPFTLKKLHNIKYLHVIPAAEAAGLQGIYAGRLMVMLDFIDHLEEFVWGIQPKNRMMDEIAGEKIFIQTMKPGKETVVMEGEKVRAIAIDSFKGFIKCRIPQTKVTVRKVASSNWITGDCWF